MPIEVIKTVTCVYRVPLTDADLASRDPRAIGERVLALLAEHLVPAAASKKARRAARANGKLPRRARKSPKGRRSPTGGSAAKRARKLPPLVPEWDGPPRRKPKPSSNLDLTGSGRSVEKVPCPKCGKQIARRMLPVHLRKTHGRTTTPPATESSAAESA